MSITSLKFNPSDGNHFITSTALRTVEIWRVGVENPINTLRWHQGAVFDAAFSHNGRCAISGSLDGTVKLWEYNLTDESQPTRIKNLWIGESSEFVLSVAFSPDDKTVVFGNSNGKAYLLDLQTSEIIHEFIGHSNWVRSVAFSPDGNHVLTGSYDETMRMWSVKTGKQVLAFASQKNYSGNAIMAVAFTPDGKYAISCGADGIVKIYRCDNGVKRFSLKGHTNAVVALSLSQDGKYLVTGSADNTAIVWDFNTKQVLKKLKHGSLVAGVDFSPDGSQILTAGRDGKVHLWFTKDL